MDTKAHVARVNQCGVSQRASPPSHSLSSATMSSLGWEVRLSNSRKVPYYYHTETRESSWEPPAELTEEQVHELPGAKDYLLGQGAQGPDGRPVQVRASHLLVKHRDSRRPSSWKEANITRTKEEAVEILKGYAAEINSSTEKFAELARAHSDCSSHANNGDLGFFKPGQMQKAFEDATYALNVGQISDVVSTESGVHLILRTG